ncbi:STN domain-containing protein [Variovorax sp. KBW07]|uniref:STN domain-containing protein n=1 Tax=Variovorax sp. KBW07 TaxID=2153358 RepID=UPI000F571E1A|nr:STN domain-containing protein [Variovorax sp. KBW07]
MAFALVECMTLAGAAAQVAPSAPSPPPSRLPSSQAEPMSFALPSQPLQAALEQFMTATGQSGLYDSAITRGLVSVEVSGPMTPQAALRQMLSASGLALRYAADNNTFTLMRATSKPEEATVHSSDAPDASDALGTPESREAYYGLVQAGVRKAFCTDSLTAPGNYRVALSLWIDASGAVRQVHLLDGSGSAERDARMASLLRGMSLPALAPQLQVRQPLTLLVMPRAGDCIG